MSNIKLLMNKALFACIFVLSLSLTSQEIEEVVVTATKKSESLQDLAFSIEALTTEQIAQEQIYDLQDLQEVIPGLITDKGVASGGQYSLRGLLSRNISSASVDSLSLNINGHSINSSSMTNIGFFDLERIEVKKGPVGTLNGRSGALGRINVITKRPSNEVEGSLDIDLGTYASRKVNAVVNMPLSDNLRTRLAVMSFQRDGMMFNNNPDINSEFDDRNDVALRLSTDWDISGKTQLKFTYSMNEADDNRTQQDVIFCAQDPFFGCSPFRAGLQGATADSRGEVDGLLGLVAFGAPSTGIVNNYVGAGSNAELGVVALNRNPVHASKNEFSNLEFIHDLSDDLKFIAKYSYGTRKFKQIDDNDMSLATVPYVGPLGPVAGTVCFRDFCEFSDSARKYSMIHIDYWNTNSEINIISDYDGPFNFTVGLYTYKSKNDNETNIATGASALLMDVATHPYFPTLSVLSGGAPIGGKGGAAYFQDLAAWVGALQLLGPTNPMTVGALNLALGRSSGKATPADGHGLIIDNHIAVNEKSIFGEMYLDLSDATKLTLGLRYDEADVGQVQLYDQFASLFHALPGTVDTLLWREQRNVPGALISSDAPTDGSAYKIALQHDLSDDVMVYTSVSTALKPGGINTGNDLAVLKDEEVTNMEVGVKSILANGAILMNATLFNTQIDGYQIGVVNNTGTDAANATAEMTGLEANISAFLNETTKIDFNFLLTDAEFTEDSFIVDYLNPAAWVEGGVQTANGFVDYVFYQAVDERGLGLMYTATGRTAAGDLVTLYKSAGFSCLTPLFNPLLGQNCPNGSEGIAQNVKGNKLPGTPELSYSLSLSKTMNVKSGALNAKFTYRFQDRFAGDAFNTERLYNHEQKYIDFLLRYEPNNGDYYLGLYAKNIVDDQFRTTPGTQSNVQGGGVVWQISDPRIWGIQFGTSF